MPTQVTCSDFQAGKKFELLRLSIVLTSTHSAARRIVLKLQHAATRGRDVRVDNGRGAHKPGPNPHVSHRLYARKVFQSGSQKGEREREGESVEIPRKPQNTGGPYGPGSLTRSPSLKEEDGEGERDHWYEFRSDATNFHKLTLSEQSFAQTTPAEAT